MSIPPMDEVGCPHVVPEVPKVHIEIYNLPSHMQPAIPPAVDLMRALRVSMERRRS